MPDHATAPHGRPDRRRQHLRHPRRRDPRGARPLRHPDGQARLRRLDDPAPRPLEGRAPPPRHPADPAVRQHRGQELHGLRADHRRDGPALLRQALDAFAIVSSDSDFTRLATRLRESGKTVYGLGRRRTPESLQAACDRFIFLEVLEGPAASAPDDDARGARRSAGCPTCADPDAAVRDTSQDDGWALSARSATTSPRPTRRSTRATTASPSSARWPAPRTTSRSTRRPARPGCG